MNCKKIFHHSRCGFGCPGPSVGERGFTATEIIVVLVILGILGAIGIPNFIKMKPNFQLKAAARELYGNMQKARMEAVKRNTNVGISFTTVAFPAEGGGYTIFVDDGAGGGTAGNAVQDGTEEILTTMTMPMKCSLSSASFLGNPRTGYTPEGLPLGNRTGTVQLRNNQSRWYQITLANSGHVRLQISGDGVSWN